MQLRQLAAIKARQHDRAARMARRRGDQPVDQTRGLDLVAPAERLDDALHVAATLAGVLDEVEILVVIFLTRTNMARHPARVRAPRFSASPQAKSPLSI